MERFIENLVTTPIMVKAKVKVNPDGPEAPDLITTLRAEIERKDAALTQITAENGRDPNSGFIDWQRCVYRIQTIARAALSTPEGEGCDR